MPINIGLVDRLLRIVVGLALIAWAMGYIAGAALQVWGWIGVIPLFTALIGYCPLYSLIGASTSKRA